MKIFRCRCAALVLALAVLAAPLASAAPIAPGASSWWSALADGLGGLLDFFDVGGTETITAEEGPHLEPDGNQIEALPGLPGTDSDTGIVLDPKGEKAGSAMDPNG